MKLALLKPMKRAAFTVSGLMMLSSLCQLGRAGPNEEKVYKETVPSVVTIIIKDENHKTLGSFGTGFIIYSSAVRPIVFGKDSWEESGQYTIRSIIVTNYHVVSADYKDPAVWQKYFYTVITSAGFELPETQDVKYDPASISNPDYDVALLTCSEVMSGHLAEHSIIKGFNTHPVVGQDVIVIGSPKDPRLANSITPGIVSGIRDNGDLIQFTAAISGGNSGSPLLDKDGVVLGVVQSYVDQAQNTNLAVSIQYVIKLVDMYYDRKLWFGQKGWQLDRNTGGAPTLPAKVQRDLDETLERNLRDMQASIEKMKHLWGTPIPKEDLEISKDSLDRFLKEPAASPQHPKTPPNLVKPGTQDK
jgi:S1-C subfamily serine protease